MSFLDLFGGDVVSSVSDLIGKVIDRAIPDPVAQAAAKEKLIQLEQTGELAQLTASTALATGQMNINALEAKTGNWWIAGWRPFIGWICGTILLNNYVLVPYVDFFAKLAHSTIEVPTLDWHGVAPIMITLLGGGGMILRSYEKRTGVQGRH